MLKSIYINSDLHKKLKLEALNKGMSLTELIEEKLAGSDGASARNPQKEISRVDEAQPVFKEIKPEDLKGSYNVDYKKALAAERKNIEQTKFRKALIEKKIDLNMGFE